MDRFLIVTFLLVNASLFSSASTAAQCWCTCTSGTRDCHSLTASECRRVDDALPNCSCSWSAAGACPMNTTQQLQSAPLDEYSVSLDQIPLISDEERTEREKEGFAALPGTNANQISRYAEFWSIRRDAQWLYFRGAATAGGVCAGSTLSYKVPLDDVKSEGPRTNCRNPPTTMYRLFTYEVP